MTTATSDARWSNAPAPTDARRLTVRTTLVWALQIAAAGVFLLAGSSKLRGLAPMVQLFDAIGIGQWFRVLTGGIEVVSAVLLLVPSIAVLGAIALAVTMVGAIATHLFVVGGSPAVPIVLLALTTAIAWARWSARRW